MEYNDREFDSWHSLTSHEDIVKIIEKSQTINIISLNGNQFNDDDEDAYVEALAINTSLTEFHIQEGEMTDENV